MFSRVVQQFHSMASRRRPRTKLKFGKRASPEWDITIMHCPDYSTSTKPIEVKFSPRLPRYSVQPKICDLINDKIDKDEYFYGIEISSRSHHVLDYERFAIMPLFTSVVWLLNYSEIESIDDVECVQLGNRLIPGTVVIPHFIAYKLTDEKLEKYLTLKVTNILALRGDEVDKGQKYLYGADLVKAIRKIRGDKICIAVGAYPQGHPEAQSLECDIQFLKEKVDCGADFIITQICFEVDVLLDYIGKVRKIGIEVPIVVGIYIPETYRKMKRMIEITALSVPDHVLHEYEKRADCKEEFQEYARKMTENMIETLFNSSCQIRGVQFYTQNYFKSTEEVVENIIAKYAKPDD